jgi:predicted ribosome quality control (RQC) complex YloA/Tae2 family protein
MYLDYFTLAALSDEYMDTIVGGKVQDTIEVDRTGLGLEIYANRQRRYLYFSADNHQPRIQLMDDKLRRGVQRHTQVGLIMRRYVEGGRVVHISQPPWDRILHFHIEGAEGEVEIIIEPMARRANVLVVQNGVILDCVRRVGPEDNRYRLSLPAHEYQPPPPQTGKRNPFEITPVDMLGFFQQTQDDKQRAERVLTAHLLGFSPLIAREIVHRVSGDSKQKARDADPGAIYEAMQTLIEPLSRREWRPGMIEDPEEGVTAFSVYPLTHLDGWEPVESINSALVAYYGAPTGEEAYAAAKKPAQAAINDARGKLQNKLNSLQRSQVDDSDREILRKSGELILAYQYTLEKGQTELVAQYTPGEPEMTIKLDAKLSPLDNAQKYFTRYNKAKRALEDVPALIDDTRNAIAYLDQLETDLEMASNWPEIDDVMQALESAGHWNAKKNKRIGGGGQSAPIRVVTPDGFVIWVGRNSRQNEIVTFKKSNRDDLWLHAREVPGAHVVIKYDGRTIPDDVIDQAASIAAYYSKLRGEGRVPVDVTRIKYVKKIKGAAQGMVTYRNERTLSAVPQPEDAFETA